MTDADTNPAAIATVTTIAATGFGVLFLLCWPWSALLCAVTVVWLTTYALARDGMLD